MALDQAQSPSRRLAPGTTFDGRYWVISHVGEGGMAHVYKARHLHLDQIVALKLLRKDSCSDPLRVRRFKLEAKAASSLKHPNLLNVQGFGICDGIPYLVMEYVEGDSLDAVLDAEGVMPIERVIGLGAQIASALGFLHEHRIVHRDIKPSNVVSTVDGACKVVDFGIAKIFGDPEAALAEGDQEETEGRGGNMGGIQQDSGQSLTRTGTLIGTPAYMSPEQAMSAKLDGRSDIYSLGCLLFELATGTAPYVSDTHYNVLALHLKGPIPSVRDTLSALKVAVSADRRTVDAFDAVVQQCLAKSPEQRFQSMSDLADALSACGSGSGTNTFGSADAPPGSAHTTSGYNPSGYNPSGSSPTGSSAMGSSATGSSGSNPAGSNPAGSNPTGSRPSSSTGSKAGSGSAKTNAFLSPDNPSSNLRRASLNAALLVVALALAGSVPMLLISASEKKQAADNLELVGPRELTRRGVSEARENHLTNSERLLKLALAKLGNASPFDQADVHFQLGCVLKSDYKFDEAIPHLEAAERVFDQKGSNKEKEAAISRYHEGYCHYRLGHFRQAAPLLEESVRRGIGGDDVWFPLGDCYLQQNRLAEECGVPYVWEDKRSAAGHDIARFHGQKWGAERALITSIDYSHSWDEPGIADALAATMMKLRRFDEAKSWAKKINIKRRDEDWRYEQRLGQIYLAEGNLKEARIYLSKARARVNEHSDRLVVAREEADLGIVSFREKKYAEAEQHFQSAYDELTRLLSKSQVGSANRDQLDLMLMVKRGRDVSRQLQAKE